MDSNSIVNLAQALDLIDQHHNLIKTIIGTNNNRSRLIVGLYWRDEVLSSLRRLHPHFPLVLDDTVDQRLRSEIFEDVRHNTLPMFPDSWTAAAPNIDTHEHLSIDENFLFLIPKNASLGQYQRRTKTKPDYGVPVGLASSVRRYIPSKSDHYAQQGYIPRPDEALREGFPEDLLRPVAIYKHYKKKIESDRNHDLACPICREIRDANVYAASYLVAHKQGDICESTLRLALRSAANIFTQKLEDQNLLPLQEGVHQTDSGYDLKNEKYLRSNAFWRRVRTLVENLQHFTDQITPPKTSNCLSERSQRCLTSLTSRNSRHPRKPTDRYNQDSQWSDEDKDEIFELIWQAADPTYSDDDLPSPPSSPPRTPPMGSCNLYELPSMTKQKGFSSPYTSASSIPSSPITHCKSFTIDLSRSSSCTSICSSVYTADLEQFCTKKANLPQRGD